MTDQQAGAASLNETPNPDAEHFAQVTSGIYRRVIPESVWLAIQYAIRNRLPAENPTIMMMFVRIAEVYDEVHKHLQSKVADSDGAEQSALQLILDPPEGIRQAEYLPDEIQSPGEMDMCWSEFLVTGSTDPIEKVVAVLDRDDLSRKFVDSMLSSTDPPTLELSDDERNELARYGIALGQKDGPWQIMSPGDIDILIWFGLKDKNPVFTRIAKEMPEADLVHLANKGAALWSLKANANQHGTIRLFCEAQAKIEGGIGRQLIDPAG